MISLRRRYLFHAFQLLILPLLAVKMLRSSRNSFKNVKTLSCKIEVKNRKREKMFTDGHLNMV